MISTNALALLATLPQTAALLMTNLEETSSTQDQTDQTSSKLKLILHQKKLLKHVSRSLKDHMGRYQKGHLINVDDGETKPYFSGSDSCLLKFRRNAKLCNTKYGESPWLVVGQTVGDGRYAWLSDNDYFEVSVVPAGFRELQKGFQPEVIAENEKIRVTRRLRCMDHRLADDEVKVFQEYRWEYVSLLKNMIESDLVADQTMMCWSKHDTVKLLPSTAVEEYKPNERNKIKITNMIKKIYEVFDKLAPEKEAKDVKEILLKSNSKINKFNPNGYDAMDEVHDMLLQLMKLKKQFK